MQLEYTNLEKIDKFETDKCDTIYYLNNNIVEVLQAGELSFINKRKITDNITTVLGIFVHDFRFDNVLMYNQLLHVYAKKSMVFQQGYDIMHRTDRMDLIFDFNKQKYNVEGECNVIFNFGKQNLGLIMNLFRYFVSTHTIVRDHVIVNDNSFQTNKFAIIFTCYDSKLLVYTFVVKHPALFTRQILNDNILFHYQPMDPNVLEMKCDVLNYKYDDVYSLYGHTIACHIFGYTAFLLFEVMNYLMYYLCNDSHAALISIIIIMACMKYIPYLLFLLLRLIHSLFRKHKYINDNQNNFAFLFTKLIAHWSFIWNIFLVYAVYGITCGRNILQTMKINDATYLNCGRTILDKDNSYIFLVTKFGYFSVLKLLLVFLMFIRQFIKIVYEGSDEKNNLKNLLVLVFIVLVISYCIDYSFSIIAIVLFGNIIAFISELIYHSIYKR